MSNGYGGGAHNDAEETRTIGRPSHLTRVEPEETTPVTQGPLAVGGVGYEQPAIT